MMKKKAIIIASILAVGAIGTAGYSASATYGESKANVEQKDVIRVIKDKYDGHVKEIEFEKDNGKGKYEVEYTKGNKKYEVEIDAKDGKVIKEEVEVANQHDANHKDDNYDDRDVTKPNENEKKNANIITVQQAIDIALKDQAGHVTEVELDEEDGKVRYEIEIETKRGEVEIKIDAKTGKILDVEYDD